MAVDLGAADESRLHLAALKHPHDREHRSAPECVLDVRVVAHRVEELAGWLVADDAELEEPDRARRVCLLRQDERDEREAHADEDRLAVADLARGLGDHELARGDVGQLGSVVGANFTRASSASQRGPSLRRYAARSGTPVTHSAIHRSNPRAVRVARWYSWKNS